MSSEPAAWPVVGVGARGRLPPRVFAYRYNPAPGWRNAARGERPWPAAIGRKALLARFEDSATQLSLDEVWVRGYNGPVLADTDWTPVKRLPEIQL